PWFASTSAMPLMPEPPMPTKWMRRTLCFTVRSPGDFHAALRDDTRRVGLAQGAGLLRHLEELRAIERPDELGELGGCHLVLRQEQRRAPLCQKTRVRRLVVVGGVRKRDENA